jgi:hypothetical protein
MIMRKGYLNIDMGVIAVAAFVAAIFNWVIPFTLIIGLALVVEKNTWLNQQVLEAGVLYVSYRAVTLVIQDWLFGSLARLFETARAYDAESVMRTIGRVFSTVFLIVFLVGAVWAIVRLIMGRSAQIPGISAVVKKLIAVDVPQGVI